MINARYIKGITDHKNLQVILAGYPDIYLTVSIYIAYKNKVTDKSCFRKIPFKVADITLMWQRFFSGRSSRSPCRPLKLLIFPSSSVPEQDYLMVAGLPEPVFDPDFFHPWKESSRIEKLEI